MNGTDEKQLEAIVAKAVRKLQLENEGEVWLSPDDLVKRWRGVVAKDTLNQWRFLGKGVPYTKIGKGVVYALSDVQEWERQNRRTVGDGQPTVASLAAQGKSAGAIARELGLSVAAVHRELRQAKGAA